MSKSIDMWIIFYWKNYDKKIKIIFLFSSTLFFSFYNTYFAFIMFKIFYWMLTFNDIKQSNLCTSEQLQVTDKHKFQFGVTNLLWERFKYFSLIKFRSYSEHPIGISMRLWPRFFFKFKDSLVSFYFFSFSSNF